MYPLVSIDRLIKKEFGIKKKKWLKLFGLIPYKKVTNPSYYSIRSDIQNKYSCDKVGSKPVLNTIAMELEEKQKLKDLLG